MILQLETQATERRDALVGRLFEAAISTMDLFTVYLGDRLGLYQALAELGPTTSTALAARTGTQERYVREWLEQQAATGLIEALNPSAGPTERCYLLPAGHDEVLLEKNSLNYLTALLRLTVGATRPLPALLEVFRSGGGVPYTEYGADTREGIAEMNRPLFINLLGSEWLPAIPEVHARLQANPPARVLDVGCGTGWSTIAIARAYPLARVEGLDLDDASIATARANAEAAGLADRVTFSVRDAADLGQTGRYDLVTAFETIHDMAYPVEALRGIQALLAPGGAALIADERVGEQFSAPGDDVERLNYGFSVLHCLASSMCEPGPAGTGTVMRPGTLRQYAQQAGFEQVEILPIENDFWRFYLLKPRQEPATHWRRLTQAEAW
jgi:2-polyprenyl-3-methyl-5-hydroxy-6-metoxy-1,4-benzoquinol methylase